jgi:hypothetical protein
MEHITLTDEQLAVLAQARDPVAIQDAQGNVRGYITTVIGGDELAEAKRVLASREPRYTTAQVLAGLRARSGP